MSKKVYVKTIEEDEHGHFFDRVNAFIASDFLMAVAEAASVLGMKIDAFALALKEALRMCQDLLTGDNDVILAVYSEENVSAADYYGSCNGIPVFFPNTIGEFLSMENFMDNNSDLIYCGDLNTEECENFDNAFAGCINLVHAPKMVIATNNDVTCEGMFSRCVNLRDIDKIEFGNEIITNANEMFYDCKELKHVKINTAIQQASDMLYGCEKLESVDILYISKWNDEFDGHNLKSFVAGTIISEYGEVDLTFHKFPDTFKVGEQLYADAYDIILTFISCTKEQILAFVRETNIVTNDGVIDIHIPLDVYNQFTEEEFNECANKSCTIVSL